MKTTISIVLNVSGAKVPPEFMLELATALRDTVISKQDRYKELTGADLEMANNNEAPPGPRIPLSPFALDMGEMGEPDSEGMIDATPAQVAYMMEALINGAGLSESEATAALQAPELPQAIAEKLVAYMMQAGKFSEEDAREVLRSGPKVDEWGATSGCQCNACKLRRAIGAQIKSRQAQGENARFN